jgi:hypothetical protein
MNDQATTLRRLKKIVDQSETAVKKPIDGETFLNTIVRPCPFTCMALVLPDKIIKGIPPVIDWIISIMEHSPRACFWDQAGLIEKERLPKTQIQLRYPTPVRIEQGLTPLNIMPQIDSFVEICKGSESRRINLLQHLSRVLKPFAEVWISIKASELARYYPLLHATDAVCVAVPFHNDSLLSVYEAVKSIHLSGYFSPIGLLDMSPTDSALNEPISPRIKNVAKQFLALDLVPAGMVLSNSTYIPEENKANLRTRIKAVEPSSRDFLYCLSESLIYQIPGLF